jgi:threonine/homoserine/homoserine lactone efflux protein
MGDLFLSLVPYGLAAAIAAPAAAVVAAFVVAQAKHPVIGGVAFVAGALVLDVLVAALVLALMESSGEFTSDADIDGWIDAVLGVIFIGIGAAAFFQTESPEKEVAQRARIEDLAGSRLAKLVLVGAIVQIVNSDALAIMAGGLKEVAVAGVTVGEEVIAVGWLLLLMLLPYYLPIVMYAIAPERSSVMLGRFCDWLLAHSRPVEIVTGLVLGGIFLLTGISSLA